MTAQILAFPAPTDGGIPGPQGVGGGGVQWQSLPMLRAATIIGAADPGGRVCAGRWLGFHMLDVVPEPDVLADRGRLHGRWCRTGGPWVSCGAVGSISAPHWHGHGDDARLIAAFAPLVRVPR